MYLPGKGTVVGVSKRKGMLVKEDKILDEMKAESEQHSQDQTPNTHYFKAQSPKLELIMMQHCIAGYFHSVKEYLGVERKPSNRSTLVGGLLRQGCLNQSQITKNHFNNSCLNCQQSWRKDTISLFLIQKFTITLKMIYSGHMCNKVLDKM